MPRLLWFAIPLLWIGALTYGLMARQLAILGPGVEYIRPTWQYVPCWVALAGLPTLSVMLVRSSQSNALASVVYGLINSVMGVISISFAMLLLAPGPIG